MKEPRSSRARTCNVSSMSALCTTRLAYCMFNGVHAPKAAAIDGLVCIIAGDSGGTPAAAPILLFRVDEGQPGDAAIDMDALAAAIRQIHERADVEIARTGDTLAVMRDLAPPEVLCAVTPTIGDGGDHVLRMPAARHLRPARLWRLRFADCRATCDALGLKRPDLSVAPFGVERISSANSHFILRRVRQCICLEGWRQARCLRPSFETRGSSGARQDEARENAHLEALLS